jgi:two-component system chemotaxis response regulator CheY
MNGTPVNSGLKGQLEDLPLIDMLQIVAFSRKTGYLQIEAPSGTGGVVFNEGLVVCAFSWSTLKYLRQIRDAAPGAKTKDALRKLIEHALQELGALREGKFHFQVTESIPAQIGGTPIEPLILDRGINPEFLLLELAKDMDESERDGSEIPESGESTSTPEPDTPSQVEPVEATATPKTVEVPPSTEKKATASKVEAVESETSVLLVDDESPVRQIVGTALRSAGFRVFTASSPSEGMGLASEIALTGERLLVVTDLGMPTTSGRSFRGGLELARLLQRNGVKTPVMLMADQLSPKVRTRAREFGIRKIVMKPGLSKLDPQQYEEDLKAFARSLVQILPRLDKAPVPEKPTTAPPRGEDKTSAPFLDFIASMTEQLFDPKRSVDISQLVLEVASKYLERGVLFLIKGEMASGLGSFGLASTKEAGQKIAQKIKFNITDARPFAEVALGGRSQRFSAEHDFLQMTLYAAIGKGRATECVLLPMVNNTELQVILYGDNAGSGRHIGKLRGLELFMVQAGMTLENTFLHQKLRAFESQNSGKVDLNVSSEVESGP